LVNSTGAVEKAIAHAAEHTDKALHVLRSLKGLDTRVFSVLVDLTSALLEREA
jgi:geranylgeranyl pyrophosphate synthase